MEQLIFKESKTHKYYRINLTVHQMLADRGYVVPSSFVVQTFVEFCDLYAVVGGAVSDEEDSQQFKEELLNKTFRHTETEDELVLYFLPEKKPNVSAIRAAAKRLADQRGVDSLGPRFQAIFVIKEKLSSASQKVVDTFPKKNIFIEFFEEDELLINISKHKLVPKHVKLSGEEKEEVLRRYRVTEDKMLLIRTKDPMARYLGLRKGDMVRIERPSETAGVYTTYRVTAES